MGAFVTTSTHLCAGLRGIPHFLRFGLVLVVVFTLYEQLIETVLRDLFIRQLSVVHSTAVASIRPSLCSNGRDGHALVPALSPACLEVVYGLVDKLLDLFSGFAGRLKRPFAQAVDGQASQR